MLYNVINYVLTFVQAKLVSLQKIRNTSSCITYDNWLVIFEKVTTKDGRDEESVRVDKSNVVRLSEVVCPEHHLNWTADIIASCWAKGAWAGKVVKTEDSCAKGP